MRNILKVFGIIALVAVIGFSMAACDDDGGGGPPGSGSNPGSGSGGTLIVTDIPSKYNGMYMSIAGGDGNIVIYGYKGGEQNNLPRISGGRVSIPLWTYTNYRDERYSGNITGDFMGSIRINSTNSLQPSPNDPNVLIMFYSLKLSNGSATKSWNDAEVVE
jgi:hypothetical protein